MAKSYLHPNGNSGEPSQATNFSVLFPIPRDPSTFCVKVLGLSTYITVSPMASVTPFACQFLRYCGGEAAWFDGSHTACFFFYRARTLLGAPPREVERPYRTLYSGTYGMGYRAVQPLLAGIATRSKDATSSDSHEMLGIV